MNAQLVRTVVYVFVALLRVGRTITRDRKDGRS